MEGLTEKNKFVVYKEPLTKFFKSISYILLVLVNNLFPT